MKKPAASRGQGQLTGDKKRRSTAGGPDFSGTHGNWIKISNGRAYSLPESCELSKEWNDNCFLGEIGEQRLEIWIWVHLGLSKISVNIMLLKYRQTIVSRAKLIKKITTMGWTSNLSRIDLFLCLFRSAVYPPHAGYYSHLHLHCLHDSTFSIPSTIPGSVFWS